MNIMTNESQEEVYVTGGVHTIQVKKLPALIVVRGSGNSNHGIIIYPRESYCWLIYERNSGSITDLSANGLTITVKFGGAVGYSIFY